MFHGLSLRLFFLSITSPHKHYNRAPTYSKYLPNYLQITLNIFKKDNASKILFKIWTVLTGMILIQSILKANQDIIQNKAYTLNIVLTRVQATEIFFLISLMFEAYSNIWAKEFTIAYLYVFNVFL